MQPAFATILWLLASIGAPPMKCLRGGCLPSITYVYSAVEHMSTSQLWLEQIKMAPKSELMTYIGIAPGNEHNFLFMHFTNTVFTTTHAIFNEHDFPCCLRNKCNPLETPQDAVPPSKELVSTGK